MFTLTKLTKLPNASSWLQLQPDALNLQSANATISLLPVPHSRTQCVLLYDLRISWSSRSTTQDPQPLSQQCQKIPNNACTLTKSHTNLQKTDMITISTVHSSRRALPAGKAEAKQLDKSAMVKTCCTHATPSRFDCAGNQPITILCTANAHPSTTASTPTHPTRRHTYRHSDSQYHP